jgi:hypothetical protein
MWLLLCAHVGSPDIYFEGAAGPYPVRVVVRNPSVVPGLAQISVRLLSRQVVRRVLVLPVFWDPRTAAPPPPDVMSRVPGDSMLYSSALWLMTRGSYGVQVTVEGDAGSGRALVPVMAVATSRLALQKPLGAALLAFGAFLFVGAVTIIGAAVRESRLEPGVEPDAHRLVRARLAMGVGAVVLALAIAGGRAWWNAVDAAYRTGLYQAPHATAVVRADRGDQILRLTIDATSGSYPRRQWAPLVPDHGHLMHLFLVRDSLLDVFAHLHPLPVDSTTFETVLPPVPRGRYRLYGDIVDESGFAQTLVATIDVSTLGGQWRPSDSDDAWTAGAVRRAPGEGVALEDGSTMVWEKGAMPIVMDRDAPLHFVVTDPSGRPAQLEPYMGMAGHAMVMRDDGAVFVHLHPEGTISLAAVQTFALRERGDTVRGLLSARLTAMQHGSTPVRVDTVRAPGALSFPYAFPKAGRYLMWVEVKRHGRILTGVFHADVQPS